MFYIILEAGQGPSDTRTLDCQPSPILNYLLGHCHQASVYTPPVMGSSLPQVTHHMETSQLLESLSLGYTESCPCGLTILS